MSGHLAHDWITDPNTRGKFCRRCGGVITQVEMQQNPREVEVRLREACPGAQIRRHNWQTAPGDMGFMKKPECTICHQSQQDVHPHSPCPGPEGPGQASNAIPLHRLAELRSAAESQSGGLGPWVQVDRRELLDLLDTYDAAKALRDDET